MLSREDITRAIDQLISAGHKPTVEGVAGSLSIPIAEFRTHLREHPEDRRQIRDATNAAIRARKRTYRDAERQAMEAGTYVPYKEPQHLGRKVSPVDIAKNPRYRPD